MRNQVVALRVFGNFQIRERRLPFAALGTEAFDVGLAKVLLRPVGGADDVVREKAGVVGRRERLVGEERERVIGGGPLSTSLFVAQAVDGSGPRIKCERRSARSRFPYSLSAAMHRRAAVAEE